EDLMTDHAYLSAGFRRNRPDRSIRIGRIDGVRSTPQRLSELKTRNDRCLSKASSRRIAPPNRDPQGLRRPRFSFFLFDFQPDAPHDARRTPRMSITPPEPVPLGKPAAATPQSNRMLTQPNEAR